MSRPPFRLLSNLYHAANSVDQAYVCAARSRTLKPQKAEIRLVERPSQTWLSKKRLSGTAAAKIKSKRALHRKSMRKITSSRKIRLVNRKSSHRKIHLLSGVPMARICNRWTPLVTQDGQKRAYQSPHCRATSSKFCLPQRIFDQFKKAAENKSRFGVNPFRDAQPGTQQWKSKLSYDRMAMEATKASENLSTPNPHMFSSKESIERRRKLKLAPSFCERLQKYAFQN